MKRFASIVFVAIVISLVTMSAWASLLQPGEILFIAPMQNNLNQFIAAEILKQKLPLVVTLDEKKATYVLAGSSVDKGSNSKWYDVVFGAPGARDSVQASVSLIKKSDKTVVWADNQGDRSVWWGALARGGERKVALRLVKGMKRDLFSKR